MKVYIEVVCRHTPEGKVFPLEVVWEDGRHFVVDRVVGAIKCASLKSGGAGIRYDCSICGRRRFLFLDGYRWYIEFV
ncbi:MAG: hypothetical protein IJS68_01405 [Clostridia bacterium]|nr:hypothetical protein [Clostridia bacterium]